MTDDNISRAAVEAAIERRMSDLGKLFGQFQTEDARVAVGSARAELGLLLRDIRSLPPAPVEGEGLREALDEAVYAIANSSGDTERPTGRDFDYEDFCVWAEQWLPRARAALSQTPGCEE